MTKGWIINLTGALALGLFVLVGVGGADDPQTPDDVASPEPGCAQRLFEDIPLTVCTVPVDAAGRDLFLVHEAPGGGVYGDFKRLNIWMKKAGRSVQFAMNAGMFHEDRSPVGLYRENGRETALLVAGASSGNFGMIPNGVFWMHEGRAGVMETQAFKAAFADAPPDYATQSGPMLVIDGDLHPRFNADSPNVNRRNGVGISEDGRYVFAVISDNVINFDTFARFFRDELDAPNALYLDGFVSRLWAKDIGRHESVADSLGPMLVWAPRYSALRQAAEK